MKNQLLKKLSAFIVTIAIGMMFSASANAQIIYTDVNPDQVISVGPAAGTLNYYINLNNDSINDYKITVNRTPIACGGGRGSLTYFSVTALNSNAVVAATSTTNPLAMNLKDGISSGVTFSNTGYLRYTRTAPCNYTSGVWPYSIDHFLGLKLIVGSNTYYGWVRMQINVTSSSASFIIKEYAYNSIANQTILAGETSCTIPTVTLAASGPLSFCAGDSVTFTANGTGYQYQWKKNNVNIAGATAQTYVAKTAGVYKCKVTNSCGSKTSGTRTVTVPCRNTNDNGVETLEHLSVYPNPATNAVTIKFPSDEDGEMQVVNLFGQIVYSKKVNAEQIQIDVSSFAPGMYVIRWSSGENFETKTFSVTK